MADNEVQYPVWKKIKSDISYFGTGISCVIISYDSTILDYIIPILSQVSQGQWN